MNINQIIQEEIVKIYKENQKYNTQLTFNDIVKKLKHTSSLVANCDLFSTISGSAYKELKKFNTPQDIMDHIYWHGSSRQISGGLKAGFNIPKTGIHAGGGYGEDYHTISISKSKERASSFSGISPSGVIYPVLLLKNAIVEQMPYVEDSIELEEMLVELWTKNVDAVKIGDWGDESEQELVVLNPKSIMLFLGRTFKIYGKERFENPDLKVYEAIYNTIQNSQPPSSDREIIEVQYPEDMLNELIGFNSQDDSSPNLPYYGSYQRSIS